MPNNEAPEETVLQINVELRGNDAEMFLAYMEKESIRQKAPAGYKLMMERLRALKIQRPQKATAQ